MELIDLRCRRTEGRRSCGALRGSASALSHSGGVDGRCRLGPFSPATLDIPGRLSAQADELTVPVLLDTRRSPDLATCGDRYRTRRHQNQIRDAKTVRVGDRRGDFTLDDGELVRCLLVGLAPLLDFDDD